MTEQPAGGEKPVYCGKHKWLHSYTAWGDLNKPIQCSSRAKMTVFEKPSMVSFCWHRLVGVHLILFNSSTWRLLFCLYTKLPWIGTKHTSAAQETQQETHSLWIEPWKKKKKAGSVHQVTRGLSVGEPGDGKSHSFDSLEKEAQSCFTLNTTMLK